MIKKNVNLSDLTTFKVGGPAKYFVSVKTKDELKDAIIFARTNNLPFFILGGGSNIVVSNKGISGLVIKMEIKGVSFKEGKGNVVKAEAGAGENWDKFVGETVKKGFCGLENLSGIPGTVGASPVQNIGAYGVELKDVLDFVEVLDIKTLKEKKLKASECEFEYRDSIFKKPKYKNLIITKVVFNLKKEGKLRVDYKDVKNFLEKNKVKSLTPSKMREIILSIRKNKFPNLKKVGTAGSFFKNPMVSEKKIKELKQKYPEIPCFPVPSIVKGQKLNTYKIPLAWILENICKLKGVKFENIGLYEKQPLVLVNYGKGTFGEIKKVSEKVSKEVFEKTGIKISNEVTFVEI